MKFSVVTPLYNGLPSIKRCIGSVRQQIHPENGKICVSHHVQDGVSTDGSVEWLAKYGAGDGSSLATASDSYEFRYDSCADTGMYNAINKGWAQSDGDVFSWLNHDEQYVPGTLEKVTQCFVRHPDVDLVWGNFICIDIDGKAIAHRKESTARRSYMRYGTCYMASCTLFYRRRLWDDGLLRLNDSYRLGADRELLIRLLERKTRTRHLSDYLSLFTVSSDNQSARFKEQVVEEDLRINQQLAIRPSKMRNMFFNSSRHLEKLMRGAYARQRISYDYCVDELGNSETRTTEHVRHKLQF